MDAVTDTQESLRRLICPILKVLPGLTLRKAAPPISCVGRTPTGTLELMRDYLHNVDDFTSDQARRRQVLIAQWSSPANPDVASLHEVLTEQLNANYERLASVAYFGDTTLMAFMHRTDTGRIASSQLELPGCNIVAKCILSRGRRDNAMVDAMLAFSAVPTSWNGAWISFIKQRRTWTPRSIWD